MTEKLQELIGEIFTDSERPDKMKIEVDERSMCIVVTYEDSRS